MKGQEFPSSYEDFDRMMRRLDRIGDIVQEREGEGFRLPDDFDPRVEPKDEIEMGRRFEAMKNDLLGRGFDVCISDEFPIKIKYLYAQHASLVTEGLKLPGSYRMMLDGCCYWCEGCSLAPWCKLRDEMEKEDDAAM